MGFFFKHIGSKSKELNEIFGTGKWGHYIRNLFFYLFSLSSTFLIEGGLRSNHNFSKKWMQYLYFFEQVMLHFWFQVVKFCSPSLLKGQRKQKVAGIKKNGWMLNDCSTIISVGKWSQFLDLGVLFTYVF